MREANGKIRENNPPEDAQDKLREQEKREFDQARFLAGKASSMEFHGEIFSSEGSPIENAPVKRDNVIDFPGGNRSKRPLSDTGSEQDIAA